MPIAVALIVLLVQRVHLPAFLALMATVVVYGVASFGREGATPVKLALSGAAVSAALYSVTTGITMTDVGALNELRFWQVGSLSGRYLPVLEQTYPFLVAGIVVVIAWFTGVILGKVPRTLLDLIAMYLRYSASVNAYAGFLHSTYPPFAIDASTADPGKDPHVHVDVVPQEENRSRLTIFFRYFMLIPQMIDRQIVLQKCSGIDDCDHGIQSCNRSKP